MEMEREKLMKRINEAAFAVHEAVLFLDNNPKNKEALDYYARYKKLRKALVDEYTDRFGPLTADDVKVTDEWTWATTPWPWELEG